MSVSLSQLRRTRGKAAQARGRVAEALAETALVADGWTVLARRQRTPAGEIDLIVERQGVAAFIEVKSGPSLAEAASALRPRQQGRIIAGAEIVLGDNPSWGKAGVRFDVMLVDPAGRVKRVADAFRLEA